MLSRAFSDAACMLAKTFPAHVHMGVIQCLHANKPLTLCIRGSKQSKASLWHRKFRCLSLRLPKTCRWAPTRQARCAYIQVADLVT
jgi:hypothetical protein